MATEEPQSLPADQKLAGVSSEDTMAVDKSSPPAVNGESHASTEPVKAEAEVPSKTTNGDEVSVPKETDKARNQEAFEANSSASKPAAAPEDSEMTDVNGASSDDKEPKSDVVTKSSVPEEPKEAKSTAEGESVGEPKAETTSQPPAGDSMDIDTSMDRPDLTSSAEHVESTQDTSAISDAPVVATPEETSQQATDALKPDSALAPSGAAPDVSMDDTPASPIKVAREREDDSVEEPAAKRAKTEEAGENTADSLVVASGPVGSSASRAEPADDGTTDDREITAFQNRQVRNVIAGIKKTKNGGNFKYSVEKLWPGLWNDYIQKVTNPVDLSLFEAKLRENKYSNYGEFKNDVRTLYENCVLFNGEGHTVTIAAASVRDQIFSRLPEISLMAEPSKPEKGKAQPTRQTEPRIATQPRRQSTTQPRVATSPKPKAEPASQATPSSATSTSAPAFAIPPNGVPQIRRDSTRDDGDRPKRPIHPPKNRDLDYASKGARKKKMDPEQKFFAEVLTEIKKGKYFAMNQWFMEPVDPVALNIPTYFSIVKKPMDLRTMTERNEDGQYKTGKDVEKDMRLVVNNSELFNGPDHDVTKLGKQLEAILKAELAKKDAWMSKNFPPEPPATHTSNGSPDRSVEESDDESEAEAQEEDNETIRNLQSRLREEQDKLNTLIGSKRPDLSMIEIQQTMVSMIQRKLVEEKTKFISEKKPKKKKASGGSKSKPKASGGGAAGSASKKATGGGAGASKKAAGGTKKAAPKKRQIGPLEKAVIADGINELDGNTLTRAVEIIKRDTGQNENDDGEMELDIDALSMDALGKLYDLINKAHPNIRAGLEKKPEYAKQESAEPESRAKSSSGKSKKNKPMNKHEQERKIEQLRELKAQLARHGSGSQEPLPVDGDEMQEADSSEESDSEEE